MNKIAFLISMSVLAFAGVPSAMAQDSGLGLDGLHEQRREGNRICMVSHFHHGSSANQPNRKAAEAAAIKDWSGFTAWEYGSAWGSFNNAGSKKVECSTNGPSHGCSVEARPCRPAGRAPKKK